MGKNQSASNLTNIIKQDANGNITFVSGSTTLMSVSSSGAITTTGVISGSNALSASYAQTSSYATNFNVSGTITATTLVVQTITSSVDFVTGSTRFGSILGNTHVFSGSVTMNPNGLFVSSSGNVGIGTSSPSYTLDVNGSIRSSVATGNGSVYFNNASLSGKFWTAIPVTNSGETDLQWYYGGTGAGTKLTFANNGNIGIGTSSPSYALDVQVANNDAFIRVKAITSGVGTGNLLLESNTGASSARVTGIYGVNQGVNVSGIGTYLDGTANGANMVFQTATAGTLTERMRITSGGLVGIGTTPNTAQLDVKQSATGTSTVNAAFRDSSTNGNALQIWNGDNETRFRAVYYGTPSNQNITFYTITSAGSEGERMRITSAGDVGIGTTSPRTKLDVAGYIYMSNGTQIQITGNPGAAGLQMLGQDSDISLIGTMGAQALVIRTNSTERMRITSDGNVQFNNVPANYYQFDVSPAIVTIASGGNIAFVGFSGLVVVNNMSNGVCALFLCGAGYTSLIGQSSSGTAGTMTYTGTYNGYFFNATYGATANYGIFAVRTRANA
jgi:hypothetical protein